jgi:hypothetical protein
MASASDRRHSTAASEIAQNIAAARSRELWLRLIFRRKRREEESLMHPNEGRQELS